MSHIATQTTKPGEPMFKDLEALGMACQMLGLKVIQKNTYNWYNRSVGDYPTPEGVDVSQLGKNAKFVLALTDEMRQKHSKGSTPYEIGMVEDPNNPGCYVPMYDFWAGGYGLDAVVGSPLFADKNRNIVQMLCPLLKQRYDMCCDALSAKQVGDQIQFLTAKDAHLKFPQLFPQVTQDTDTWVSIVDTSGRVQTSY